MGNHLLTVINGKSRITSDSYEFTMVCENNIPFIKGPPWAGKEFLPTSPAAERARNDYQKCIMGAPR